MAWTIEYSDTAQRTLQKLDPTVAARITKYMASRVATASHPWMLGRGLTGRLAGRWRYRVGDYRVVCDIKERLVTILVVKIGHRSDVYE